MCLATKKEEYDWKPQRDDRERARRVIPWESILVKRPRWSCELRLYCAAEVHVLQDCEWPRPEKRTRMDLQMQEIAARKDSHPSRLRTTAIAIIDAVESRA